MAAAVFSYKGAALAPMAPPSAPVQPAIRNPVAEPAASPLAPFGLPVGFIAPAGTPPGEDVHNPLAPTARELPGLGGGGGKSVEAAGPQYAVQFNEFGEFTGTSRFLYNENNAAVLLDGSFYFTSPSGGTVSAVSGILNLVSQATLNLISQSGNVNIQPTAGGIGMSVAGPNVMSFTTAAAGFIAIQGALFRTSSVTVPNMLVTLQASSFQVTNSSQSVSFFTVNPNFGTRSPINMNSLPTNPVGLGSGDVWINDGVLTIIGGTSAAAVEPPPPARKSKSKRAIRAIRHLAGSLVIATGGMVSRLMRRVRLSTVRDAGENGAGRGRRSDSGLAHWLD